jgi:aryl-alcohol dehydrogenase-like predicted oxidoreductase
MNFGNTVDEKTAHEVMDYAREVGINFFDTANMYGGKSGWGACETMIGNWFAKGGGRREDTVITTKFGGKISESKNPNEEPGVSLYKMRRHLEASLKRLKTDHVEIYMTHGQRPSNWREIMEAAQALVYGGKIDYFATNGLPEFELALAQNEAEKRGFLGIAYEQHAYSLLNRGVELGFLDAIGRLGIGLTILSPQNGGLLSSGVFEMPNINLDEETEARLKKYHALCSDIGHKVSHVTLAWIMCNPNVTCPLIGVETIQHIEDNLKALEIKLADDVLKAIDEIFPPINIGFNFQKYFKVQRNKF